jgi:hypothetical protein
MRGPADADGFYDLSNGGAAKGKFPGALANPQ